MEPFGWLNIRRKWVYLRETLALETLVPHLFQTFAIAEDDMERINGEPTSQQKADRLLLIMKSKECGYIKLCKALQKTQPFIVNELENATDTLDSVSEADAIKDVLVSKFCESSGSTVKMVYVRAAVREVTSQQITDQELIKKVRAIFPTADIDLQAFEIKNVEKRLPHAKLNSREALDTKIPLKDMDVQQLSEFLRGKTRSDKTLKPSLISILMQNQISGKVFYSMTLEDFKMIHPQLPFGEQKSLIIIRDEIVQEENKLRTNKMCNSKESPMKTHASANNSDDTDLEDSCISPGNLKTNLADTSNINAVSNKRRKRAAFGPHNSRTPKRSRACSTLSSQPLQNTILSYFQPI